jgi:SAM-dependent methyltransferase
MGRRAGPAQGRGSAAMSHPWKNAGAREVLRENLMDIMPDCRSTRVWTEILCCPQCHGPLALLPSDVPNQGALQCNDCGMEYPGIADSFDLSAAEGGRKLERQHYQEKYLTHSGFDAGAFDSEYWAHRWADPHWPEGRLILSQLGDLKGKVVLCLGNGDSIKELHFLTLGAKLICSDLSLSGVIATKSKYNLGGLAGRAAFHALDACRIAVRDHSVDVVYGYEFVHHLPDLDAFFQEVHRVLKPGGICIFFDNAYSPIWQTAKRTLLWPLMRLSHLLHQRSPEDIRATYTGGYEESFLQDLAARRGFHGAFFHRVMFFQYLFINGVGGLLGWKLPPICYRIPGTVGRSLDRLLTDRFGFLRRSKIGLVWGFRS